MSGHSGLKTNELTLISAWDAVLYPSLELKVHAIIQNIIIEHFRDPHANIYKIQKRIYIYIYIVINLLCISKMHMFMHISVQCTSPLGSI